MVENVLFSIGMSITFLIFTGLLINEIGSIFYASKPLSTEPLAIIINIIIIVLLIIDYFKNRENLHVIAPGSSIKSFPMMLYVVLLFLNVVGVVLAKTFNDNSPLILAIIIISILFLLNSFTSKLSPYYPLALASIALILLLNNTSLVSNYILGHDVHLDYVAFKITNGLSYWDRKIELFPRAYIYNSMASITVLPTIFSKLLNIDEAWVFKIIFPLIFSLVPLALYELHLKQWGKEVAFISILFFMSNKVFFDFRNTAKEYIAEFLFILIFLVLLRKDVNQRSRWVLLICLYFALVVSYYTLNYLFLVLIFFVWLCRKIFVKNKDEKIDSTMVVLFFVLTVLWYIYIAEGLFDRFTFFLIDNLSYFFEELFYTRSRGAYVEMAIGAESAPNLLHQIGRIIFDVTAVFILIGFIKVIIEQKKEKRLNPEYFLLMPINMALLLMCIVVPRFAVLFQMDRMYHVTLLFLSPLFVIGGKTFFESLSKILHLKKGKRRETYSLILILTVLVTFFLFQTGFIYEIAKDPVPSSISLSKYRMDEYTQTMSGLVNENDFLGAMWLSNYGNVEKTLYSDTKSVFQVLTISMIDVNYSIIILNNEVTFNNPSYIYLNRYNTRTGILIYDPRYLNATRASFNITEIYIFNNTLVSNNKLYSNSACEIYYYNP
jgi:uncharacterized membrane protein